MLRIQCYVKHVMGLMLLAALLNRWIKISGQLAFAAFSAIIFVRINMAAGLACVLFLPWLAWSRVTLSRHAYREVFVGFLLGMATGVGLLFLS